MVIRTKKYKLPTGTFIKLGMVHVLKKQWWVALIVIALCCGYFLAPNNWWFYGTAIAVVLYLLFWLIQFAGVTQMEQSRFLFEKLSYEITSQQILIKVTTKQGMPIKWDQVKRAERKKGYFTLYLSLVQMIHLPNKVFNSDNERKFLEAVLKRKGYIK